MAISAVSTPGGTNAAASVAATSLTVNPSPAATTGNIIIVFLNTSAAISGLTVKDNNNVALTAGPVQGNLQSFYYVVPATPPTGITASWTGSVQCSLVMEEYSGATKVNPIGATASGSSGTATITLAITAANNFIVVAFGAPTTLTATVGTSRQKTTISTAQEILQDNTSATVGNVINTATFTPSATWTAIALEIGGAGKPRVDQDVQLVLKQVTSNKPRVNQDLQLVLKQVTSNKPHVNQDIQLVLVRTHRGNVGQDLQLVLKQPTSNKPRVSQDLQLVLVKNTAPPAVQPFVFVTC